MDWNDVEVEPPPKSLTDWLDIKLWLEPISAKAKRAKSAKATSARSAAINGVAENVGMLVSARCGTCVSYRADFYYFVLCRIVKDRTKRFCIHEDDVSCNSVFEERLILEDR